MGADGKAPTADKTTTAAAGPSQAALSAAVTSQQAKSRSNLVQTVDLGEMYNNPGKASASSVLEFIMECYLAQWQSVLRNCE